MTSGRRKKRGSLSPEDRELWGRVTRTLTPLSPDRMPTDLGEPEAEPSPQASVEAKSRTDTALLATPKVPPVPKPPPLHQLEHRFRKKLVRGSKAIEARIDLHGMTQHQAHGALRAFLYRSQAKGHKVVLVITGKGGEGRGFMDERGVLRRVVPQWLAMPDIRTLIVGYEEAHAAHGGSGALYVRIRRKR
ncbi:Smr/MutS family protein [Roseibium sediminis]|uniref:Smr/MutS family protein n=1 Tax=Roseibium sediminis TaxID=1775174 RepID=UPI00123DF1E4|nr:Smr/MutS family protein [Roseibium sediminis]